jgi:hypothetical protein
MPWNAFGNRSAVLNYWTQSNGTPMGLNSFTQYQPDNWQGRSHCIAGNGTIVDDVPCNSTGTTLLCVTNAPVESKFIYGIYVM